MINLLPSAYYSYATRHGDKGTDVAALQINLPRLEVDGVFGDETEAAVKTWQYDNNLVVDGIAGMGTQQSIITQRVKQPSKDFNLPIGLLKSIASNESGFALAAAGPHLNDSGWDVGAFCRSSGSSYPDQEFLYEAYDVRKSAKWTANHVIAAKEALTYPPVKSRYYTEMGEDNEKEFLWKLAILSHNWPVAARNIASRGTAMITAGADDKPAQWIIDATNGRLSTPRQWCMGYVARATVYVKWER